MIIPTPERWIAGEDVTAERFNEQARDMLEFLLEPPQAVAIASTSQSINNAVWTVINLDTTVKDNDGIVDLTNNRFTIVTPGWYEVMLGVGFGAKSNSSDMVGRRIAGVRLNGSASNGGVRGRRDTTPERANSGRSCRTGASLHTMFLNKDDYIELVGYQDSGEARSTYSDATSTPGYLAVRWVSN